MPQAIASIELPRFPSIEHDDTQQTPLYTAEHCGPFEKHAAPPPIFRSHKSGACTSLQPIFGINNDYAGPQPKSSPGRRLAKHYIFDDNIPIIEFRSEIGTARFSKTVCAVQGPGTPTKEWNVPGLTEDRLLSNQCEVCLPTNRFVKLLYPDGCKNSGKLFNTAPTLGSGAGDEEFLYLRARTLCTQPVPLNPPSEEPVRSTSVTPAVIGVDHGKQGGGPGKQPPPPNLLRKISTRRRLVLPLGRRDGGAVGKDSPDGTPSCSQTQREGNSPFLSLVSSIWEADQTTPRRNALGQCANAEDISTNSSSSSSSASGGDARLGQPLPLSRTHRPITTRISLSHVLPQDLSGASSPALDPALLSRETGAAASLERCKGSSAQTTEAPTKGHLSNMTAPTNEYSVRDLRFGPVRSVSRDYPIKPWMIKKGLVQPDHRCPYRYTKTFTGKYGIVNYDCDGNFEGGSVVLCFHGLNATRLTYEDIQNICAKYGYFVVTFDLYGHGLSANPPYRDRCNPFCCRCGKHPTTYSIDFFVQQAEELMDHLKCRQRPHSVIGFSMGGIIAAKYTAKNIAVVDRLVLISSAGLLSKTPPTAVQVLKCCKCCISCIPFYICPCCCSKRAFAKAKKAFSSKFSPEELKSGISEALWSRLMWQLFIKKGVVEAFLGSVANVPMWTGDKIFKEVGESGIPVLLLWGTQDLVAPVASTRRILECIPNAALITFDECSHLLLADEQQAAAALLLTFLDFPRRADMERWRFLLPFTARGQYVPREERHPGEFATSKQFLESLGYRPRLFVKLPPRARIGSSSRRGAGTVTRASSSPYTQIR